MKLIKLPFNSCSVTAGFLAARGNKVSVRKEINKAIPKHFPNQFILAKKNDFHENAVKLSKWNYLFSDAKRSHTAISAKLIFIEENENLVIEINKDKEVNDLDVQLSTPGRFGNFHCISQRSEYLI